MTSGQLSTDRLDVHSIIARGITNATSLECLNIKVTGGVQCKAINVNGGASIGAGTYWQQVTIDGTTYNLLVMP